MYTQEINVKNSGATFTPTPLADFLSDKILQHFETIPGKCTILDPACGTGVLLASISTKINNSFNFKLMGYETNADYLIEARKNLSSFLSNTQYLIEHRDFLEASGPCMKNLFSCAVNSEISDIVIAKPPYVRTQILGAEKSQQLAKLYNLRGKVDLYYPFLIGMTNLLKKGGFIGVITSNRYLTTKSGAEIRKFLLENYDVLEVIDLGDTKLFEAAVLPAIFIGRKKFNKKYNALSCRFVKIYEKLHSFQNNSVTKINTVYDILKEKHSGVYSANDNRVYDYSIGTLIHPKIKTDIWQMTNDCENKWIDKIRQNTDFYIGDKFKVRVGIKSCADNVFLSGNWDHETMQLENSFFKPLISRENIERWTCKISEYSKVLYPHYSENGKRSVHDLTKYPKVALYLNKHRKQLEGRKYLIQARRKWYEFWVPQNPELWNFPKLVFPDISIDARFSYDESGAVVNGNCYWIVARDQKEKELLMLVQGVANSSLMAKYHDLCFNNKLYSGRRRYLSQYIEKYPMPDPENKYSRQIIDIVKLLNTMTSSTDNLEKELNICVSAAFDVTD